MHEPIPPTPPLASILNPPPAGWTETRFQGGLAWESVNGRLKALVSEARSRLLYFGEADGSLNLLSCPPQVSQPEQGTRASNWGGHRFWLGPQVRWVWPPLADWEFSPAASIETNGGLLLLQHPRTSPDYPALVRSYAWEGTRLRCTVSWADDGRLYYGMHVFPIETPASISVLRRVSAERPAGLVSVSMDGYGTKGFVGHPAYSEQGDFGVFTTGTPKGAKAGCFPQTLRLQRAGGWSLALHPGPNEGVAVGAADSGFLSQVWVGDASYDFAELEQLSPFLTGDASGKCSSTCYLEGTPP